MSHGNIRPTAPTQAVVAASAAAEVKVPVSTVAAIVAASPILKNDVISPPRMNDSPMAHQVRDFHDHPVGR